MSIFAGTATYYRRYRPGIPDNVIARLAAAVAPRTPRKLLDLCTGTGLVVQGLLGQFHDIIAVDVDPEMLAVAAESLRRSLPPDTTLRLFQCTAEAFVPPLGWRADLATISRAFHWLDQTTVLSRLDSHVSRDGAVAILAEGSFWLASSDWQVAVRHVIQEFLGARRRAGDGTFHQPNRPFGQILRESPFRYVEEFFVPVLRSWSTDSILGYLYSTSFATARLFGDRRAQFEATLRERLAECSDDGTFIERNEFAIQIGRRSPS